MTGCAVGGTPVVHTAERGCERAGGRRRRRQISGLASGRTGEVQPSAVVSSSERFPWVFGLLGAGHAGYPRGPEVT